MSDAAPSSLGRTIAAASAGTVIEWYDFYIFGTLAPLLAEQFFPRDPNALLKTLGIYATGFLVRPLGSVFFRSVGDIIGRRYAFLMTLVLMGGSTFLMGLLPTTETIGMLAPVVLVMLRVCQGLALGGEYGSAAIFVVENAPVARRGYFTGFIQTTASLGLFASLGLTVLMRLAFGAKDFAEWGWRVPFLLALPLIGASHAIRQLLKESPMFAKRTTAPLSQSPVRETLKGRDNLARLALTLFGAAAGQGVIFYTSQYYVFLHLQTALGLSFVDAGTIVATAVIIAVPFFVVSGRLSDHFGRKRVMMAACLLAPLLYVPVFHGLTANKDRPAALVALATLLVLLVCLIYGPIATYLVESFPLRIRHTSMSFPYHIGNGVFGGLTPIICLGSVDFASQSTTPWIRDHALYMGLVWPCLVTAITFVVGIFFMHETRGTLLGNEATAT